MEAKEHAGDIVTEFHAHIYYNHDNEASREAVVALRDKITSRFIHGDKAGVSIIGLREQAVGVHPTGNLAVLFSKDRYGEFVNWLAHARHPQLLNAIIHPLSQEQVLDHTDRAVWLGTPQSLRLESLTAEEGKFADKKLSREQAILWIKGDPEIRALVG